MLRVKRGLRDTAGEGGFFKDQCYLRGAVEVLRNRRQLDLRALFLGKLSVADLLGPRAEDLARLPEGAKLPRFLASVELYRAALDEIAATNFIF